MQQHLIDIALPLLSGGEMVLSRDCGGGCTMTLMVNTDETVYLDYLMALRDDGFKVIYSREAAANRFSSLVRDELAVTMYYTAYARTVRILVEPKTNRYIAEPMEGEPVCQPQLTMIGRKFCEHATYLGADSSMGLTCFVFRLGDGSFLVYDGGVEVDAFADGIMDALKCQAPDPAHIVIAGWILSHGHGDHLGGIRRFCRKYPGSVELRQVFHNFPSDADVRRSDEPGISAEYPHTTLALVSEAFPGVKFTKLHNGDCFMLRDAQIETLYTQEDFYTPLRARRGCHYLNDTSLVMRITLGGQKIMMLADTHQIANTILSEMYGDYLKSDLVQVTHHGGDGGTCAIYDCIDADFAFFTTSDELVPIYISRPYNTHMVYELHLKGYANAQKRTMVFPLPYHCPEGDGPVFVKEV